MAFNVHTVIDRDSPIWRTLAAWPKIELHRHLEGAIRLTTLIDVAREYDIPLPAAHADALRPYVQITDSDEASAEVFLSKFDVLRRFYTSMEIIRRITIEAIEDAARDNVTYMELRFTPHALTRQNNDSYRSAILTVCEATAEAARAHTIDVRLIVSVNRHESVTIAHRVLDAVLALNRPEVVALDLAGQEFGHNARPFRAVFLRAQEAGLHTTVHAGEWDSAGSVREAIEVLGAERLGHGVRAVEDSRVVQLVRERGVTLEVCPTSNLQSGVVKDLRHHPLIDLTYLNTRTTINTDDPALSNICLTDELALAHVGLGLPLETLKTCIINAASAAFLSDDARRTLIERLRRALDVDETV